MNRRRQPDTRKHIIFWTANNVPNAVVSKCVNEFIVEIGDGHDDTVKTVNHCNTFDDTHNHWLAMTVGKRLSWKPIAAKSSLNNCNHLWSGH
tara:strand:+ start:210 stop:485 length:276 start_codon:yes stop_codon:yes gene_type:complete